MLTASSVKYITKQQTTYIQITLTIDNSLTVYLSLLRLTYLGIAILLGIATGKIKAGHGSIRGCE